MTKHNIDYWNVVDTARSALPPDTQSTDKAKDMNWRDQRICATCDDEEGEHITMTDGSVYCHACWFHGGEGPTTKNGSDERSRHPFAPQTPNPQTGRQTDV